MPGIAFEPSCGDDTVQAARGRLFAAEVGRAERVDDQTALWREAVAACAAAGMGWEQRVASFRLAATWVESGTQGTETAELLREIHAYTVREGAAPLRGRVGRLPQVHASR